MGLNKLMGALLAALLALFSFAIPVFAGTTPTVSVSATVGSYIDVTPNYDTLTFTGLVQGTSDNTPTLSITDGLYNMSISSNDDWKSQIKGDDFTGAASYTIGNMAADANLTAANLALPGQAVTTGYLDFGSGSLSDVEYHGFWLDVPALQQSDTYTTTIYLSYSTV